jgi:SAM-dependent methyltransferase
MATDDPRSSADAAAAAPTRGQRYDLRFEQLAAAGHYLHGEADLVDALLGGPPARVLDAGCGTGRVAIELARRGYETHGVDVDPSMLDRARVKAPALSWQLADLAQLGSGAERPEPCELALAAGNVLRFVEPKSRPRVVAAVGAAVVPGGMVVLGCSLAAPLGESASSGPPPIDLDELDCWCRAAGLVLAARWADWDRTAWTGGDYVVSVHWRIEAARLPHRSTTNERTEGARFDGAG